MKLEHESVAILVIYTLGPSVVPSVRYIQSYIDDSEGMCQVAAAARELKHASYIINFCNNYTVNKFKFCDVAPCL